MNTSSLTHTVLALVLGAGLAQPADKPKPAATPTPPEWRGLDQPGYQNPLFMFSGKTQKIPMTGDIGSAPPPSAQLPPVEKQGLETPWPAPPERAMTAEEQTLMALAIKVAPSVISIRVWDEYGGVLSNGVGCFVSAGGLILTDASLVHPEIADRVDYITTTAADGTNHRITGYYLADLTSGVALLQSEGTEATPFLSLKTEVAFVKEAACHVFALSEKRGLVLADAKAIKDPSLAGQGWLNLRGEDSPGAVGSPVIDNAGSVVAVVGMRVPLKSWMNFALPADMAAYEIQRRRPVLKSLKELPRTPKLAQVTKDKRFIETFNTLTEGRAEAAVTPLLRLTQKYPRSAECWALLGLAASEIGALEEATNCQRKAVALDPQSGLYWHQLAMARLRSGDSLQADASGDRETLEQATELRPADHLSWLLLATQCLKERDYAKADDALRQVAKLAPDYAHGFYLLAYNRGKLKDYDGASIAIQRSLELDSGNADAWFYQGLLFTQKQQPDKAVEAFKKATRLAPNEPRVWMHLAHACLAAGDGTGARAAFREAQKK